MLRLGLSEQPLSGDDLAGELGLSRVGIWKHIQILKKQGVDIKAYGGKGYVLNSAVFHGGLIQTKLTTKRIGHKVVVLDITDSTNQDAMQQAEAGADEGLVIFANQQRKGKGRLGRSWHTLPDALAGSVLLRPQVPPEEVPQLSLLTAVALHDALSSFAPAVRIKWPNDVLCQGAKVAGILTEMRAEPGHVHAVVLGFGINMKAPVLGWPDDISQSVTDMGSISALPLSRFDVAVAVLQALDFWYDVYLSKGFAPVRRAWWQAHAASGDKVRVHHGDRYIEGIATALDDDGALLLRTSAGLERIIAGDLELL